MQKESNPFLRPSQVAKLLSVRLARVYRWIAAGRLPAKRMGGSLMILRSDALGMIVDVKPANAPEGKPAFVPHAMAMSRLRSAGLVE